MWTLETYEQIYTRYKSSGLSASDFYHNEGITRSRFYYWQKKYRKLQKNPGLLSARQEAVNHAVKPHFIPVAISEIATQKQKKELLRWYPRK